MKNGIVRCVRKMILQNLDPYVISNSTDLSVASERGHFFLSSTFFFNSIFLIRCSFFNSA
jgi:hypothetical protein